MYDSRIIANYFIDFARQDGATISPMKLQKLVYFAHGYYLAITGKPLIEEEIQAWQYGPVIESLYHEVKHYGNNGITEKIRMPNELALPKHIVDFLQKIWEVFGTFTAVQLSNMTHETGAPWEKVWKRNAIRLIIPSEVIREYFSKQLENSNG